MFDKDKIVIATGFSNDDQDSPEFLPLLSQEDEDEIHREEGPETLAILPLRNTVLFPGVVFPITVGRDKSIKLIKDATKSGNDIGVVAQVDASIEEPFFADLYKTGTIAQILKVLKMPDGNTTVILQGKRKFSALTAASTEPYLTASVLVKAQQKISTSNKTKALIDSVREMAVRIIEISPHLPSEASFTLKNIDSPNFLVSFIASNLNIPVKDKQEILEQEKFEVMANLVLSHLTKEMQMLELKNEIQTRVKGDLDKQQRDYFLQQQIRALQEELGQDSTDKEIQNLRLKAEHKLWNDQTKQHFERELERLQRSNPMSPDYAISLNYLNTLVELPWNEFTKDSFDLNSAKKILDRDHFGLEKVKDRILEYLAVLKLKGDLKSPILCLYGPPGVGKTSLGKSIAEAVGRKYVRMSLGGVRDEAEIRGHRKTYIGAMPGRIMQSVKKAQSANPVFILDEIDKLASDFRGDPSSALLEVLDPEQNGAFYDNYVETEFDLSKVMFIATANYLDNIQPALLDRMEVIEINGYTLEEKKEIAKNHLIKKQREAHGLKGKEFNISDDGLNYLIEHYTSESGVRNLDRKIASLALAAAKSVVEKNGPKGTFKPHQIEFLLGPPVWDKEEYQGNEFAGVVTGLAWTPVGGSILFVESSITKGKGKLTLTGKLGEVMKESAITALTFLKAHAEYLDINPSMFDVCDIHIHFPAGAIPKDGPSAGITILTSLASLFTQRKVKEKLAMTGEITLRGKVLPVGGIKEKLLAAKRAGISTILLSKQNAKDIHEIKEHYIHGLNIQYVDNMLEVLDQALTNELVKNAIRLSDWLVESKVEK